MADSVWLCIHVIFSDPLLRIIRLCCEHCGIHNGLKNMKIFEATENIPKGAMTKTWNSGAKIELENATFRLTSARHTCRPQIQSNRAPGARKKKFTSAVQLSDQFRKYHSHGYTRKKVILVSVTK
jgi:hypothetical protein